VESEAASYDEPDSVVEAFNAAVGKAEPDGGEDPVAVCPDGSRQFDERVEAAALCPRAPPVQQVPGVGFGEATGEDGSEGFLSVIWP
jgi:hypothetical protein